MALTLDNGIASFTFDTDATTGLKLTSFARQGGHGWINNNNQLWVATVYNTTTAPLSATATVTPTAATLAAPAIVTDFAGQYLSLVWTAVPVGADTLTVTLTLRLNDGEDFLRCRVACTWAAAASYALDSVSCLSLAIDPYHNPTDYAVLPFGFGIQSENPILNLRYSNGVPGFPVTGFGILTTNKWTYPAGRGWSMAGPWGYYETQSNEAWMIYCEDWSLEVFYATFESNATQLTWSFSQPQSDNVLVGNNGRALGSGYTFCLRPFLATQAHAWVDMGKHYRERVDQQRPVFWVDKRRDRASYSPKERGFTPFIEIQAINTGYTAGDGNPGDIKSLIDSLRANSGIAATTPIAGIIEAPTYNLHLVAEDQLGDFAGKLLSLYTGSNCHLGLWFPVGGDAGEVGPDIWDIRRWNRQVGDQNELRWWTTNGLVESLRMSRIGYLAGGGVDRLMEVNGRYYRERAYTVSSYTATISTVIVGGSPGTDGFTAPLYGNLIPTSAAQRMSRALVTSMGLNTIRLYTGFQNYLGTFVTPTAGMTVEVFNSQGSSSDNCFHAESNSTVFMRRLRNNTTVGVQDRWGGCGYYLDVFSEPMLSQQATGFTHCYRAHTTWTLLDAGYLPHPLGGGSYHKNALREYAFNLRQGARIQQATNGVTEPFFWMSVEDIDETCMDVFDWCWHNVSAGNLWRNVAGTQPTVHKYKTIPLYAVVYAGKTMGRGVNNELTSLILQPSAPFNDPDLQQFLAYCLAVEWPYGLTWPTMGFYRDSTYTFRDYWDNTQYQSAGGLVSDTVKSIRDLWSAIQLAEVTFVEYLRNGEFLPPLAVDLTLSDTTTSYAGSVWTLGAPFYHGYDTIYEHATFPRVVHAVWQAADDSIAILLVNWTTTTARFQGTTPRSVLGFAADDRVRVRVIDHLGNNVERSSVQTSDILSLGVNEVPALSVRALILDVEPALTANFRAVQVLHRW